MNKHIEDLSKPVAWTDAAELAELNGGTYANIFNGKHINTTDGQWMALYSQEYVDSLLAKLEAAEKSNSFLKEQLSQLANFNPDWDRLEACQDSWRELAILQKETLQRAEAAEARLLCQLSYQLFKVLTVMIGCGNPE